MVVTVMTPKQFAASLEQLDLNHSTAASTLGIGRRSILRYVNGEAEVPENVTRLITMLRRYGVPAEWKS